jgi:hypothetical protein
MGAIWFDDGFSEHHKLKLVGTIGRALQFDAICYAAREQTNGFVPSTFPFLAAEDLPINEVTSAVAKLEAVGVWDEVDDGWIIHDYSEYHATSAELERGDKNLERVISEIVASGNSLAWDKMLPTECVMHIRRIEQFSRILFSSRTNDQSLSFTRSLVNEKEYLGEKNEGMVGKNGGVKGGIGGSGERGTMRGGRKGERERKKNLSNRRKGKS